MAVPRTWTIQRQPAGRLLIVVVSTMALPLGYGLPPPEPLAKDSPATRHRADADPGDPPDGADREGTTLSAGHTAPIRDAATITNDASDQATWPAAPRYQPAGRWTATTLDGSGLMQGDPTTLTYSFVPDGTFIPDRFGFSGSSNLVSTMDAIYPDTATWQQLFVQVLDRYSQVCGITFILEPNDDGADLFTFPGQWGIRGDIRFAGMTIDGSGGSLGVGTAPDEGDVVIDTADPFFADISSNSLRLRNLLSREVGHALGLTDVCPMDGTKLMEPVISLTFDGPQHDDIRGVQYAYGDPFEPDDQPATAHDVGTIGIASVVDVTTLGPPSVAYSSRVGLRTGGDVDYTRFCVPATSSVTVVATPLGLTYADNAKTCGVQLTDCCTGGFTDSLTAADLAIELIDTDGVTVLATAASQQSGSAETIASAPLATGGCYYVRVFSTAQAIDVQLYSLSVAVSDPIIKTLHITLPNGPPTLVPPGAPFTMSVTIDPGDETLIPGSELLFHRNGSGSYTASALTPVGGNDYVATLPAAACADTPEFYFSATGSISATITAPPTGPAAPFAVTVGQDVIVLDDDFEQDLGWTVDNDPSLTGGAWERNLPMGGGDRGDPPTDFDTSGQCYLTEAADGNTDVDGGATRLTSPQLDLTGGDTTIRYAVWYTNNSGGFPDEDVFTVEISNDDGANWSTVQTVGPTTSAGWSTNGFAVVDFIAPTAQVRLRFEASDFANPSIVEAGVDAVRVVKRTCAIPLTGDFDGDGDVDLIDYTQFADCWSGPGAPPTPTPPVTVADCLNAFDADGDTDLDISDAAAFQSAFSGP